MRFAISRTAIRACAVFALAWASCFFPSLLPAETSAHRLILKDGSYQAITKYEISGDRVRYFSAERGEWEEVPKALVDWDATEKYEQGRLSNAVIPEAAALDKELEAERKAAEARSPQVAPGLRLPEDSGVYLLDTYQSQPQLNEIEQSGSDLNRKVGSNILRSAINPLSGQRQSIELTGAHAKIQSHTAVPTLYANVNSGQGTPVEAVTSSDQPLPVRDHYKIIRLEAKNGKRVAGSVKIAVTGKTKTDERFVAATVTEISGGWVKITPVDPLPNGEYAVAEMLTKDGMNLYVWDFGVNPDAAANVYAINPEPEAKPLAAQPNDLKKRENQ